MALTHILNSHSYDGRYLQVSLTQTKDAANRRSIITGTVTSLAGASGWYATGPTTVTVAGTQRYSRARESSGTGQSNKNFVGTIPEFYISHDTSGNASVSVSITTAIYASATQTSSNTWTLDSIGPATTACGAPTSCSVNQTLSDGNVTLSWSGATSGTSNTISSYEIQYSESSDNATWGAWTALTTITTTATNGSASVSPSGTRGYYRRFQVRTRGSAGSSYYSVWKISTNSVRRNVLPSIPTTFTASPATYASEAVILAWSGVTAGTSMVSGANLWRATSTDGTTWGAWVSAGYASFNTTSGSYTDTGVSRTAGTYTKYRIQVEDTFGAVSGYKESNAIFCNYTACGAPTACSVSSTLTEGTVTLSWSGATSGAGNAIASYEIQYSESSDNSTWGAWTALTTVTTTAISGSATVSASSTRGYYRRFQVRTRGAAGASYYSAWKVSTNSVQKNTLPTAPTSFTASPAVYQSNSITLTWSGAKAGTSPIKQYLIQLSTSTDNSTWTSWATLQTVDSSAAFGSLGVTPSSVAGTYTMYRISVTDTLGAVSSYVTSNTIKKNSPPQIPYFTSPNVGSTTYNSNPRFLIKTRVEPDGQLQIVCVKTAEGVWEDSGNNPDKFSRSGYLGDNTATIYVHDEVLSGSKTVSFIVKDKDVLSESPMLTRSFTVAASPFTEIVPNETHVKAQHILALRVAVNNVRNYYTMTPFVWKAEIIPSKTLVLNWPSHILELRKAVDEIIAVINNFDTVKVFDIPDVEWIPITTGRPKAAVMNQLQELILTL